MQPVKSTPLAEWIARGEGGHYVVKRLAGADSLLTERNLARMRREAARFAGRDYDLTFEWSDEKIYCSELIWKIYDRALGIRLAEPQRLGDFDLSTPAVREKLAERYGDDPPLPRRPLRLPAPGPRRGPMMRTERSGNRSISRGPGADPRLCFRPKRPAGFGTKSIPNAARDRRRASPHRPDTTKKGAGFIRLP